MATATKTKGKAPARSGAKAASRVVPLGDRVVVKQTKQEEVRASGLVIPDTANEKPQQGEVIAVGPGRLDDNGKRLPDRRQGRRPRPLRQVHRPGDPARRLRR